MDLFLFPLILAFVISAIAGKFVRLWYIKHHWLDDPKQSHHPKVVHTYSVPRGGGLVVFLGLLLTTLLFIGIDKHLLGILAGAFLLAIIGTLDDIFDLHPYWRLLGGLIASALVVGAGIGIAYITNPITGGIIRLDQPQISFWLFHSQHSIWILSDLFAIFWITWCMNMLNWSKGVDGQLPGIVVIASVIIGVLSLKFAGDITQWPVIQLAAITAGSFLGLLFWNIYPQRMMPGYGAGTLAGFLLAVLSILSGAKLATLLLVLAVPMADAVYVIFSRLRGHRSPIWGDRGHLHHALMDLSWGKRRIAFSYWITTLILGIISLQLNSKQKAFTILLIGLVIWGIGIWLRRFITYSKPRDPGNG